VTSTPDSLPEGSSSGWEWSSLRTIFARPSTLKEITEDNIKLRESGQVQEKWFDIELPDELCSMRKDTKLVVVDIPGVNEAGSRQVHEAREGEVATFDCVVVVMDGKQGVNSEEQVNLLNLVKESMDTKEVPTLSCNKVDDPTKKSRLTHRRSSLEGRRDIPVGCRETAPTKSWRRVVRPLCCLVSIASLIPISAVHVYPSERVADESEQFQPLTRK
jgi:GTPase Era involved in 16S rRNA processing